MTFLSVNIKSDRLSDQFTSFMLNNEIRMITIKKLVNAQQQHARIQS